MLAAALGMSLIRPGPSLPALAVVLVAARFGYVHGAATGAVAGLASLLASGQDPAQSLSVFADRGALAAAFAFPALGALVGLVGDVPRQAARRAEEAAMSARGDLDRLMARHRVLVEAKEAVDRRIVGQVQTVASLYEAARELEALVPEKIPPATLALLARFLEVEAAAIYRIEGRQLVRVAAIGDHAGPETIAVDAHPLGAVIAGLELRPGGDGPLLAVPLHHLDGRPRGVIAIEKLPFRQLTPATQQMLGLFADWASRSLATSEAYVEAQARRLDHPVTRLPRVPYMTDRLHQEWAAARRYALPLSAILVRDPALSTATEASWAEGAKALAVFLKERVRTIDVVGHHRTEDAFLMLLPVTPLAGASVLAGRLAEALPGCLIAVGANEEGHGDAEALILALQARVFEEASHVA